MQIEQETIQKIKLDTLNCSLNNWSVIEASAGTGKTWTIARIYLRLLLEKSVDVSKILVLTFTNSATEELRTRIQDRIATILQWLALPIIERNAYPLEDAELLEAVFEHGNYNTREAFEGSIKNQLNYAFITFDQASIFTIHSFCQRALSLAAFSSHQPFSMQLENSDDALIEELAYDYWRKYIADIDNEIFISYLESINFNATTLINHFKNHRNYYLAQIIWPENSDKSAHELLKQTTTTLNQLRLLWGKEKENIKYLIDNAIEKKKLNRRSFSNSSVQSCFDSLDIIEKNPAFVFLKNKSKSNIENIFLLSQKNIEAKSSKNAIENNETLKHPFFDLIEAFENEISNLHLAIISLIKLFIEQAFDVLNEKKIKNRTISFNDMLLQLYEALKADQNNQLSTAIFNQFPFALIDEFQDTDPLQYQIFSEIYPKHASVFLVGDPKQAIYSFRGADLQTYITATNNPEKTASDSLSLKQSKYTLYKNFRSNPELIQACNALFEINKNLFIENDLSYVHIDSAVKHYEIKNESDKQINRLNLFMLPEEDYLTNNQANLFAANITCQEVARLINAGNNQDQPLQIYDKEIKQYRHVKAGDIAILVNSHKQANLISQTLLQLNIHSVVSSRQSIWQSTQAKELYHILQAIVMPNNSQRLFAALSTEILGYDANDLAHLLTNERALSEKSLQVMQYLPLWQKKGCGFTLRKIIDDENISEKLLSLPDGDRQMTNLLQLIKLLDTQSKNASSIEATIQWYQNKLSESDETDENLIRLETDENLVKINTIHVSKGLEYGFVFCPFLWALDTPKEKSLQFKKYHKKIHNSEKQVLNYDWQSDASEIASIQKNEAAAENIRLIYVALTRAVHRCYIVAGNTKSQSRSKYPSKNVLQWLFCSEDKTYTQFIEEKCQDSSTIYDEIKTCEASEKLKNTSILYPTNEINSESIQTNTQSLRLKARLPNRQVYPTWHISSFTGLSHHVQENDITGDHDEQALPVFQMQESQQIQNIAEDDILLFPKGSTAGSCIHAAFERADFTAPSTWPLAVAKALEQYPQSNVTSPELAQKMMLNMLNNVLNTPLNTEKLCLNSLSPDKKISEWEFYLNMAKFDTQQLNQATRNSTFEPPKLNAFQMQAYFKGFVDLVFEKNNRHYIIDWKSNYLGDLPRHYSTQSIREAMMKHHYDWQYLLYTVALHRLLRSRMSNYNYERDFGGVFYLFIRGVRPEWKNADQTPTGVFFYKPDFSVIDQLDKLLKQ